MSLQFVLGKSGSGKSTYLYEQVINQSIKEPKENFFLLVPEQFTMGTQREVIRNHPRHGSFNIDVVSFLRLAYRIFDELGVSVATVLEDQGKSMVLKKLLWQLQPKMKIYHGMKNKAGFIDQVKSIFSEFYQYEITTESLKKQLDDISQDTILYSKLSDILLLYEAFETYMGNHFIVAEKMLDLLSEYVEQSQLLKDASVYVDGYTGFTPVQYQLIQQLLKVCKKVVITITIDEKSAMKKQIKPYELFALGYTTMKHLKNIAANENIILDEDIILNDNPRLEKNAELFALEKNLFQYPLAPFEGKCEHFQIAQVINAREEVELAANQIHKLVREKGYRYQEIVVLSADTESYPSLVEEIFPEMNIPYFLDGTVSIFNNPVVEAVRSILNLVVSDFSHEKVFRFLKTEMGSIHEDQIPFLENYIIACGIRGISKWKTDFIRKVRGVDDKILVNINELRKKVITPILPLYKIYSQKDIKVKDAVTALYEFMVQEEFEEQAQKYVAQFQEESEYVLAKSYEQVFAKVVSLLDKLVEVLGEDTIRPAELVEILDAGFEQIDLGVIPSVLDKVLVGDLERSRFEHVKAILFLGANEGIVPKQDSSANLIGEEERRLLSEKGLELAPDKITKGYMDQFYLYFVLTKASEEIVVSYKRVGNDGKALRPSYIIDRFLQIYPKLQIQFYDTVPKEVRVAFLLKEKGEGSPYQAVIKGIQYEKKDSYLSAELAKKLYGETLFASVTRLETYASCAYRHFLAYGLNLYKRQENTFQASDFGTLIHKVMELLGIRMSKEKQRSGVTWQTIEEKQLYSYLDEAIAESFAGEEIALVDTARGRYIKHIVKRMAERTVGTIHTQLAKGKMEPTWFEMEFPMEKHPEITEVSLEEDCHMVVRGKIDRIDTYEELESYVEKESSKKQREIYLKIVDYKTGNQGLEYGQIYCGIQLQLLLYLDISKKMVEKQYENNPVPTKVHTSGVYYYHVDDPVVADKGQENPEIDILKELQLKGLTNIDENELLVNEEFGESNQLVSVPIKKKKNGELYQSDNNVTSEELEKITHFAMEKTKKLGNEILKGNAKINPYHMGTRTGCDFCEMKGICQFEDGLFNQHYKEEKRLNKEDFLEKIGEEKKDE